MSLAVQVDQLQCQKAEFRLGPVSFDVAAGGRLAIVGPSGSGKTTMLRCVAGLERPDAGTIRIGDTTVDDGATHLPPDRRHLGLVFQDGALWSHMTAVQHLTFAAPKLDKRAALALLERAGIADQAKKKPNAMSGGEAQRLGLLRALAPSPEVLLLDEPLRSVDVHQRDSLVLLLRSLCDERNVTTILVTHDRDEALALATDLVVMRDGKTVEAGAAGELLSQPKTAFTAAFLRGAACLPATINDSGRASTPFGEFDTSVAQGDTRLVLFPGEVTATDTPSNATTEARVLAVLPSHEPDGDLRLRVACHDQILIARAATTPTSATIHLQLHHAPRLLPWNAHSEHQS